MKSTIKILGLCAMLMSLNAWAYYDVLDNGEILERGKFKVTTGVQALTDTGGGNIDAIIDAGINEEFGVRGLVGFGRTDYSAGALLKWMPIPDVENQPAIGANFGLLYGKWNDARDLTFRFEPLVSKKFVLEEVTLTPYASLPLGIRTRNSDTQNTDTALAFQFATGAQVQVPQWKNLQFMGEVGVDLDKALSHVSVAAIWYFDESGFELK
jgi:hypothetical protein